MPDVLVFRYLTGNPCTEYEGYREYVVATLPQLKVVMKKDHNLFNIKMVDKLRITHHFLQDIKHFHKHQLDINFPRKN